MEGDRDGVVQSAIREKEVERRRNLWKMMFLAVVQQLSGINLQVTGAASVFQGDPPSNGGPPRPVLPPDAGQMPRPPLGMPGLMGALLALAQLLACVVLWLVIIKLAYPTKRRWCWGVGCFITMVGALGYGLGDHFDKDWVVIFFDFVLMLGFGYGCGPLTWLIGSELALDFVLGTIRYWDVAVMASLNFLLSFCVVFGAECGGAADTTLGGAEWIVWLFAAGIMGLSALLGGWIGWVGNDPDWERPANYRAPNRQC